MFNDALTKLKANLYYLYSQNTRLVILASKYAFDDRQQKNPALAFAENILNTRGTVPRKYKNILLFLAADSDKLAVLKKIVREFKAWSDVIKEADLLNLDRVQIVDAKSNFKLAQENFAMADDEDFKELRFGDIALGEILSESFLEAVDKVE